MDVPHIDLPPRLALAADLVALTWPQERLSDALQALARHTGLTASGQLPAMGRAARLSDWLPWAAATLDLEAEPVTFRLPELGPGLSRACPALLAVPDGAEIRFLLLVRARPARWWGAGALDVLSPDLRVTRCTLNDVCHAAAGRFEAPLVPGIDCVLHAAGVTGPGLARARAAMLQKRLATQEIDGCWMLRLPATAPFFGSLKRAGVFRRLGWVTALLAAVYGAEVLGWALIGAAALDGRLDLGWLVAWLLLLVSQLPLRLCGSFVGGTVALDIGRVLKRRLLAGALRLGIDTVRRQGTGQLLGRVMESQALESLAVSGAMTVLVAGLELAFSAWILSSGVGGAWLVLILLGWLAATLVFCGRYYRRLRTWSVQRLDMTHELIEHMVGHRTRLAQERPGRRDTAEDGALRNYFGASRALDDALVPVAAGGAGLWAVLALVGMAPAFMQGTAAPAQIAISLGGIILANRAFGGIAGGIGSLAQAGIAWRLVAPLFHAAGTKPERQPFIPPRIRAPGRTLIEASDLVFRYRPEGMAVLRGVSLAIQSGDRILLEGPSGGGKSTLAALLTGLRVPESGLLLLNGLDRPTLGSAWRQLATGAPQFHDNHILSGSLAFNLLMGRAWPALPADLAEARALCIELGLGPLLERMPAGLQQQVGETGWQLSHGERSRVFLARALLQDAALTILDESFAALDPQTLQACLRCATARDTTLVVIAHP